MRARIVGMIVGGVLLWVLAPPAAEATGCNAEAAVSAAAPGDKSASVDAACSVSGGPAVEVGGAVQQDGHRYADQRHHAVDLNGDGHDEVSGRGDGGGGCPPPESQGVVTGIVCPLLPPL